MWWKPNWEMPVNSPKIQIQRPTINDGSYIKRCKSTLLYALWKQAVDKQQERCRKHLFARQLKLIDCWMPTKVMATKLRDVGQLSFQNFRGQQHTMAAISRNASQLSFMQFENEPILNEISKRDAASIYLPDNSNSEKSVNSDRQQSYLWKQTVDLKVLLIMRQASTNWGEGII